MNHEKPSSRPLSQVAIAQTVIFAKQPVPKNTGQIGTANPPPGFKLAQVMILPKIALEVDEYVLLVFTKEDTIMISPIARASGLPSVTGLPDAGNQEPEGNG